MKPKIVCDICRETLEVGDPGGGVQYKRCYKCVINTCDKAPSDRILKPANGETFEGSTAQASKKEPKLVLCYKWFPPTEHNIERHLRWIIKLETYEKRTLMEITFSKDDLKNVIKDIEEYEYEERVEEQLGKPEEDV